MYCFISRRVSTTPVFAWAAIVMLCTSPGAVRASPIEARLAEIIDLGRRGCGAFCHYINPAANVPSSDATSDAPAPVATGAPEPEESDTGTSESSTDTVPPDTSKLTSTTSGAFGRGSQLPSLLTWAIAGTGGAILATL